MVLLNLEMNTRSMIIYINKIVYPDSKIKGNFFTSLRSANIAFNSEKNNLQLPIRVYKSASISGVLDLFAPWTRKRQKIPGTPKLSIELCEPLNHNKTG